MNNRNKNRLMTKKGFTLAEVLITLTVIGVIAALTIPSLIQNIQDAQYKTAWKKEYSDFNQATQKFITDNGGTLEGTFSNSSVNDLRDKYSAYFTFIAKCDNGDSTVQCNHIYTYLNGNSNAYWKNKSKLMLNNGTMITFDPIDPSCNFTGGNNGTIPICAEVRIDVNGLKGPNIVGKDIFGIWIQKNKILPDGSVGDAYTGSCVTTGTGCACSALYLMQ